jgi:hypothetical protein
VRSSRAARRILDRVSCTRLELGMLGFGGGGGVEGGALPDFALVAETVFAGEFQFGIETGGFEGSAVQCQYICGEGRWRNRRGTA